jgi:hypothetical protein
MYFPAIKPEAGSNIACFGLVNLSSYRTSSKDHLHMIGKTIISLALLACVLIVNLIPAHASCLETPTRGDDIGEYAIFNIINNCASEIAISYTRISPSGKTVEGVYIASACKSGQLMDFKGQYHFVFSIPQGADMNCQHTSVRRDDKNLPSKPTASSPAAPASSGQSDLQRRLQGAREKAEDSDAANQQNMKEMERDAVQADRDYKDRVRTFENNRCITDEQKCSAKCSSFHSPIVVEACPKKCFQFAIICRAKLMNDDEKQRAARSEIKRINDQMTDRVDLQRRIDESNQTVDVPDDPEPYSAGPSYAPSTNQPASRSAPSYPAPAQSFARPSVSNGRGAQTDPGSCSKTSNGSCR